jgi:hypothetical protein
MHAEDICVFAALCGYQSRCRMPAHGYGRRSLHALNPERRHQPEGRHQAHAATLAQLPEVSNVALRHALAVHRAGWLDQAVIMSF